MASIDLVSIGMKLEEVTIAISMLYPPSLQPEFECGRDLGGKVEFFDRCGMLASAFVMEEREREEARREDGVGAQRKCIVVDVRSGRAQHENCQAC
jgi:hypothetical protein